METGACQMTFYMACVLFGSIWNAVFLEVNLQNTTFLQGA